MPHYTHASFSPQEVLTLASIIEEYCAPVLCVLCAYRFRIRGGHRHQPDSGINPQFAGSFHRFSYRVPSHHGDENLSR